MTCRTIRDKDGVIWLCGPGLKGSQVCRVCGHLAEILCDYPVGNGKTCDAALCREHAFAAGIELDYCQEHAKQYGAFTFEGSTTPANNNGKLPRRR